MPWRLSDALSNQDFKQYRVRAIFRGNKWDPHLEDRRIICDRSILISEDDWQDVSRSAERLYQESKSAEAVLRSEIRFLRKAGLIDWWSYRAFKKLPQEISDAPRLMRFDFHPTNEGWKISEVNSDVPGGINEASSFPKLFPSQEGWESAGDPAQTYAEALKSYFGEGAVVGLMHATSYSDDWQLMNYVGDTLESLGMKTLALSPTNFEWKTSVDLVSKSKVSGLVRLFPGDWILSSFQHHEIFSTKIPMSNPLIAVLSQHKSFLVFANRLRLDCPEWSRRLPETFTFSFKRRRDSRFVTKPVYGRVGEDVIIPGVTPREKKSVMMSQIFQRRGWINQRRFYPLQDESNLQHHLCLGVYVVNGKACGAYGRVTKDFVTTKLAQDAPVFIDRGRKKEVAC